MGDWADLETEKIQRAITKRFRYYPLGDEIIAEALRQARLDALEEAANPSFLRELVLDQSCGEWGDKTIDEDVAKFSTAIRALKDKT